MYQQQPINFSQESSPEYSRVAESRVPLVIGRSLNVLNPLFRKIVEQRDEALLLEQATRQLSRGARGLAINPGPGKEMNRHLVWVLETLSRNYDVPLFVPAHSPQLEDSRIFSAGKWVLNGVAADPEVLRDKMRLALRLNGELVVLLFRSGTPTTLDDKLQLAVNTMELADEIGLDQNRLYFDPVITTTPDPLLYELRRGMPDLEPLLEAIGLLDLLCGDRAKIIMDLENIGGVESFGQKSLFWESVPGVLFGAGLDALIMDCRMAESHIH